jgi:hypothetical protein
MEELMKSALQQGLGYGLFVCLFIYVLKTTGDRENKYQTLLDKLTDKFNIVDGIKEKVEKIEDIKEDVKEIKNKIEGK